MLVAVNQGNVFYKMTMMDVRSIYNGYMAYILFC